MRCHGAGASYIAVFLSTVLKLTVFKSTVFTLHIFAPKLRLLFGLAGFRTASEIRGDAIERLALRSTARQGIMETVRLHYVPATNRRTMARLGHFLTMKIDGQSIQVSPDEMEGEVEWRIEVLRWRVRKTFHYLASIPRDDWYASLLEVEKSLMLDTGLHRLEAQAVAESALRTASELSESSLRHLNQGAKYFDALINGEWQLLRERHREIVRSQPFDAAKWTEVAADLASVSDSWLRQPD
jgi:hypothetical protein